MPRGRACVGRMGHATRDIGKGGRTALTHEPSVIEILRARLRFRLFGKASYRAYANRLPIRGDEAVLDFGCGLGGVAYYVAACLPAGSLTCHDRAGRWLRACRRTLRRRRNVVYLDADADLSTLAEESFGLVYCHSVFNRAPSSEFALALPQLARLLKPGGLVAYCDTLARAEFAAAITSLARQSGLFKVDSRVTDVPFVGSTIENIYARPR